MAWDMPVQDLRQAPRDHLPDEERHIVAPLCDDDQFTFPKELCGLGTQLHAHGVLSSRKISPLRREDNNSTARANMPSTPLSENLPKIQLWEFFYGEWGAYDSLKKFGAPALLSHR